jgi:hypothetical protein
MKWRNAIEMNPVKGHVFLSVRLRASPKLPGEFRLQLVLGFALTFCVGEID